MAQEREVRMTIHQADPSLITAVDKIAANPGNDTGELRQQVATIAKAVKDVAVHCKSLTEVLTRVLNTAVFEPR